MTTFTHVFSLALLHFLWQGMAVASALWIALLAMRKASANARYLVSCCALALLMLLPAATAYLLYKQTVPIVGPNAGFLATSVPLVAPAVQPAPETGGLSLFLNWFQVWGVPVWCFGVVLFSVRLVWGARQVSVMRRRGEPAEEALRGAVARIAERMGVTRTVGVLISALADGPSVVGFLRPVILLPAATILGLPSEQLEAVLAHELAHIRRYDYVVNMVQVLAEALLFYHPAVWWTSGRIRRERELSCDDEAVRVCGDALRYARALTALERIRVMTPSLALGGTDGPLAYRINRVMGAATEDQLPSRLPGLAGLGLSLGLSLVLATGYWSLNLKQVRAQAPDVQGVHVDLGSSAVIHRAPVQYPAAAQIGNVKGTVSVEVRLDEKGNVSDAHVLSGPEELRKPVLQSVLGWHFTPDAAGATRVINVEFSPSPDKAQPTAPQEKPLAVAVFRNGPPPGRAAQLEQTSQFLWGQVDQAKASLAEAHTFGLSGDDLKAREAKLQAALAMLAASEARVREAEAAQELTLDTRPTRQGLVLPPFFARDFAGRTLQSIRLTGIGMSTEDFLAQTQLPISVGDTLTESSIESTIEAVRKFDEHLSERWTPVARNGMELTIYALDPALGPTALPGALAIGGAGIGGGVGGGVGIGAGPGSAAVARTVPPAIIYRADPEYTDQAKAAKWQGTVVLSVTVDESGNPANIKVARSLGMGLDEKAIEAIQKWRFRPGMRDGKPVATQATVELNFRLPEK
jgi:TonB family protein